MRNILIKTVLQVKISKSLVFQIRTFFFSKSVIANFLWYVIPWYGYNCVWKIVLCITHVAVYLLAKPTVRRPRRRMGFIVVKVDALCGPPRHYIYPHIHTSFNKSTWSPCSEIAYTSYFCIIYTRVSTSEQASNPPFSCCYGNDCLPLTVKSYRSSGQVSYKSSVKLHN